MTPALVALPRAAKPATSIPGSLARTESLQHEVARGCRDVECAIANVHQARGAAARDGQGRRVFAVGPEQSVPDGGGQLGACSVGRKRDPPMVRARRALGEVLKAPTVAGVVPNPYVVVA